MVARRRPGSGSPVAVARWSARAFTSPLRRRASPLPARHPRSNRSRGLDQAWTGPGPGLDRAWTGLDRVWTGRGAVPQAGPMLWLARGEHELPADDGWLSPAESARSDRMRFTKRRTEYRLRRWTGKQAVAAVAGLDPAPCRLAGIEVLNRPSGAPYVLV